MNWFYVSLSQTAHNFFQHDIVFERGKKKKKVHSYNRSFEEKTIKINKFEKRKKNKSVGRKIGHSFYFFICIWLNTERLAV